MLFNLQCFFNTSNVKVINREFYYYRQYIGSVTKKFDERIFSNDILFHKSINSLLDSSNLNVNEKTPSATPEDGICQCDVLATDYLGKWVSNCWRSYWDIQTYNRLYAYRQEVLNRWGTGSSISMAQFWQCQDVDAATFIFLACFEGPRVPNYDVRKSTAAYIYQFLTGSPPPTPPVPPTPPPGSGVPAWLLKKIADKNNPNYMI
jgi:hypothetical protein